MLLPNIAGSGANIGAEMYSLSSSVGGPADHCERQLGQAVLSVVAVDAGGVIPSNSGRDRVNNIRR